jgi:hypothetical protein
MFLVAWLAARVQAGYRVCTVKASRFTPGLMMNGANEQSAAKGALGGNRWLATTTANFGRQP